MNIAERGSILVEKKLTAKDYLQDGLMAMWDAIENNGYGQHVSSQSKWVDLIGGYVLSTSTGESVDFDFNGRSATTPGQQMLYNGAGDPETLAGVRYYQPAIDIREMSRAGKMTMEFVGYFDLDGFTDWSLKNQKMFGFGTQNSHMSFSVVPNGIVALYGSLLTGDKQGFPKFPSKTYFNATMCLDGPNGTLSCYLNGECTGILPVDDSVWGGSTLPIIQINTCFSLGGDAAPGSWDGTSKPSSTSVMASRIYGRALSQEEVLENFRIDQKRFGIQVDPKPYTSEVEYLESTGTQYIDFNQQFNNWDIEIEPTAPTANQAYAKFYCGAHNSGSRVAAMYAFDNSTMLFQNYNREGLSVSCDVLSPHSVSVRSTLSSVVFDGEEHEFRVGTMPSTSTNRKGFFLFGSLYGNTIYGMKCMISKFKAYDDSGNIVLDMVPVRVGQTGYLYNKVNPRSGPHGNGLYSNAGTGNFYLGPDVKDSRFTAKDYVQDGLVAMWDGIENIGYGKHNAYSSVWKDLSNNDHDLSVNTQCFFEEDCLRTWTSRKTELFASSNFSIDCMTAEYVVETIENIGLVSFFGKGNGKMFCFATSYVQFMAPYEETFTGEELPKKASVSGTFGSSSRVSAMFNGQKMVRGPNTNNWSFSTVAQNFGLGGGSAYKNYQMTGRIFCVRLYSRALNPGEIKRNYLIDRQRFNLP